MLNNTIEPGQKKALSIGSRVHIGQGRLQNMHGFLEAKGEGWLKFERWISISMLDFRDGSTFLTWHEFGQKYFGRYRGHISG